MKKIFIGLYISLVLSITILFSACQSGIGPGPTAGTFLRVDNQQCIGCRECVKVCNADAITIISNKAVIDVSKCIECLKCVEICPVDAIE